MLGLITKDLLCLKKSGLKMLVILMIYAVIFSSSGGFSFLSAMIIVISTMMILNTFAYDELSKWDYYALSLPVSKKQIVLSKYLLTVLLDLFGILLSVTITLFARQWNTESFLEFYALACTALILTAILLPLLYKFGTQKARIWMFILFLTPTAAVLLLNRMGLHLSAAANVSDATVERFVYFLLPAAVLLFVISFFLSYGIFRDKEI